MLIAFAEAFLQSVWRVRVPGRLGPLLSGFERASQSEFGMGIDSNFTSRILGLSAGKSRDTCNRIIGGSAVAEEGGPNRRQTIETPLVALECDIGARFRAGRSTFCRGTDASSLASPRT